MRGSSILRQGIVFEGYPYSTRVCVTMDLGTPASSTRSPAYALSISIYDNPVFLTIFVIFPASMVF